MSLKLIKDYIEQYEDVLENLDESYDVPLPVMYAYCDIINSNNYYSCDFSKNKNIHMLFYNGSSNFFAGLYVPENVNNVRCDECPIYIFDLASDNLMELIGNFKTYMKQVFDVVPKNKFKQAKKNLEKFSDKLENYEYQMTVLN